MGLTLSSCARTQGVERFVIGILLEWCSVSPWVHVFKSQIMFMLNMLLFFLKLSLIESSFYAKLTGCSSFIFHMWEWSRASKSQQESKKAYLRTSAVLNTAAATKKSNKIQESKRGLVKERGVAELSPPGVTCAHLSRSGVWLTACVLQGQHVVLPAAADFHPFPPLLLWAHWLSILTKFAPFIFFNWAPSIF